MEWMSVVNSSPIAPRPQSDPQWRQLRFHRLHDRRFTVYLDVVSPDEWKQREAEMHAELERQRKLDARTVDVVQIGEPQSERDHRLKGERHWAGKHRGRNWRHALSGGWFSYEMKVQPDAGNELLCTFWGSDSGGRIFDILIEDEKIATEELVGKAPDKFFDVIYAIPTELTKGRTRVTVKLQAHPGRTAGGLFGARVLKAE